VEEETLIYSGEISCLDLTCGYFFSFQFFTTGRCPGGPSCREKQVSLNCVRFLMMEVEEKEEKLLKELQDWAVKTV
jgi:hypothetical protein